MSDKQFTIQDMIGSVNQESPSEFQNAFNDLILDKIAAAVDAKKQEVAQNYFNNVSDEEEHTDEENEEITDEDTETTVGEVG